MQAQAARTGTRLVSFSPLSTSPFALTHTRTHTWLAVQVSLRSRRRRFALFPHLFWLRSHFRFGKRRSNNSWHKLRLLQYTVTASKQTDSSTNGQPDRGTAGQAGQTSDCEGQQRPQWSFISRTLRHFDLHCKKELEASACMRVPWAWLAATCGSYLSPSEKARDCVL